MARAVGILAVAFAAPAALAILPMPEAITDLTQMNPANTLVDFESLAPGPIGFALDVQGLHITSEGGLSGLDLTPWPINGTHVWHMSLFPRIDGDCCAPVFTTRIDLPEPVSEFGFAWFDPNYGGNVARFFGVEGELLAEVYPELGPRWGVHAVYIGLRFEQDLITRVEVVPAEMGDVYAIDHISFGRIIPAPGALAVLALGLAVPRRARQ